jgi:hypothetical protein
MPNTTVFLLDIIGSNSLHGPVRELHQDNGISNQIILLSAARFQILVGIRDAFRGATFENSIILPKTLRVPVRILE